ncbi:AAC(3) family N-acetyltransferase [Salipaludibacillus keqinensis]|uniref:Aminoglycoside N(3)-acetyltransferase n=1 Tax=Salipaludibacillus keqinensis TaxID=2045207 RepID=A0A323TDQ7_9BACI|nr:AAC(3) family N-acetyltransferase [Salipaludibacillus keqinensis]PYZ91977.1 AAC(3) family N-acetyltransferase [Salipaludibacillus keqinensis]
MEKIVNDTKKLNTIETLENDLKQLGLKPGMTVLVHSSLSAIGWTNGGAVAVIQALMETVTVEGTVVMPTQSGDWSDPKEWEAPAVPKEWWEPIRQTMPSYHPNITPTRGMGRIVEVFRSYPDVIRSLHPAVSFAAWGKNKQAIIENHRLDFGLGETSPLGRLYELEAQVLFIGTDYETNTCFHLGENRAVNPVIEIKGAPIEEGGQRVWKTYEEVAFEEDLFQEVGKEFEAVNSINMGEIGQAKARLFSLVKAVDFATDWFNNKRK